MPQVESYESYEAAEAGKYLAILQEIETKSAPQRDDKGEEKENKFWVWKFSGYRLNDKERKSKVKIEITTGRGISDKTSALKSILQSAFPGKPMDWLKKYNTDGMIGKTWVLKIGVEAKSNGKGNKNVVLDIEESEEDVFAEAA